MAVDAATSVNIEGTLDMALRSDGLRIAVTGAAGFIGRAVTERLDRGALGKIAELRLNDVQTFAHPRAVIVSGSYADPPVRDRIVADGIDVLFHLASLPGGASERDPALGKRVNLDGSIALLEAVAGPRAPVVVYASSIAVLGRTDRTVTEDTALRPASGYGTHKAMIEFYLADLTRRGLVDGRAVRPSAIVARPRDALSGFATAWMSDLFHAALEGRAIAIPAAADKQVWLQSIDTVADNIVHAAQMPAAGLPPHRAWTLPATVVRVDALVAALDRSTGHALSVDYCGGAIDHPPLDASAAASAGFIGDDDVDALVDVAMARIARREHAACRPPYYSLLRE